MGEDKGGGREGKGWFRGEQMRQERRTQAEGVGGTLPNRGGGKEDAGMAVAPRHAVRGRQREAGWE